MQKTKKKKTRESIKKKRTHLSQRTRTRLTAETSQHNEEQKAVRWHIHRKTLVSQEYIYPGKLSFNKDIPRKRKTDTMCC